MGRQVTRAEAEHRLRYLWAGLGLGLLVELMRAVLR